MKGKACLVFACLLISAIIPAAFAPSTPDPSAGDTWTRPADGAEMVYVPAGEFLMGSTDDDPNAAPDEKPQHTVNLDAFWIDKTEVTNAQYRKCVEAGACEEPGCWALDKYNAPDQPVVCVSWDDATAFADWCQFSPVMGPSVFGHSGPLPEATIARLLA